MGRVTDQSLLQLEVLLEAASLDIDPRSERQGIGQDGGIVQWSGLLGVRVWCKLEFVRTSNHLLESAEAHLAHVHAHLLSQHEEVVDDMLRCSSEFLPQHRVLSSNAHWAGVQVAFAHHGAAHYNQWSSGKSKLICSQQSSDHHIVACNTEASLMLSSLNDLILDMILTGSDLAIHLEDNSWPEVIHHQGLVGFCNAQLPGETSVFDASPAASPSASIMPRDCDMLWFALNNRQSHLLRPPSTNSLRHKILVSLP